MRHSWRPVSCYLVPLILLTVLYNLPRFWELRLGLIPVEGGEGPLSNSSQQQQELKNYVFSQFWSILFSCSGNYTNSSQTSSSLHQGESLVKYRVSTNIFFRSISLTSTWYFKVGKKELWQIYIFLSPRNNSFHSPDWTQYKNISRN